MTRLFRISFFLTAIVAIEGHNFQGWTQIIGNAWDVSTKGNELWAVNRVHGIYRWKNDNWVQIPGNAVRVGASPDGWSWVVNSLDEIYRFNVDKNDWDRIPGNLVQVNAMSKDRALGVNRVGGIYLWENNAWKQIPGYASWAAIGDGDERWVVNSLGNIYRWNHSKNDWDHIPGNAANVDTQNANKVIVTNKVGGVYVWESGAWQQLPGNCMRSTINNEYAYCVNSVHNIYKGKFGSNNATTTTSTSTSTQNVEKEVVFIDRVDGGDTQEVEWKEVIIYEN